MSRSAALVRLATAIVLLLALTLAACGGDDDEGGGGAKGTKADQAFLEAMIPHHESAVAMANVAKRRGEHREVKKLATDIVAAQSKEIAQMERIHKRLFGSEIKPDPGAHEALGISAADAGMEHEDAAETLRTAQPFDRAFIDEMVPHHQGAIRMAQAVASKTDDLEVKRLAGAIIEGQSHEIRKMNRWRRGWYGSPSPAGGIPRPSEGKSAPKEQEHDAH
jgi:uncharacterized protein (DUF305 family)